jgi:hypothetical protein
LAVIAGAWFVVGRTLASTLRLGDVGQPIGATDAKRAVLEISYFSGLGALIVFLGGAVLARVTIRTARDVQFEHDAELAPKGDNFDAFPAATVETDALTQATPQSHRREDKGGFFRRRGASATSQ